MKTKMKLVRSVIAVSLIGGCSGEGTQPSDKIEPASNEPVELIFYSHWLNMSEAYFNEIIGDPVRKKFPNVTLKFMLGNDKGAKLPELLTSGTVPDIIYAAQFYAVEFRDDLKAVDDMSDLIKKHNVNLGKFEPSVMDAIKAYDSGGKIYALPFALSPWALWYNKDIFDKFGVPYPKDGMTWDETIDLAKKVTKSDGTIDYRGLLVHPVDKLAPQLSLPYVDQKTLKPLVNQDGWKRLFDQFQKLYAIPGIYGEGAFGKYNEWFMNDKTLAMLAGNNIIERVAEAARTGLNWDVATYPAYPDKPNLYPGVQSDALMLSPATKHREIAFQVINHLTSEEVQMNLAKKGKMSSLKDPEFHRQFAVEIPETRGKQMQSIFKSRPAPLPPATKYDSRAFTVVRKKWNLVMEGKMDINTALRESDQEIAKIIEDDSKQQ